MEDFTEYMPESVSQEDAVCAQLRNQIAQEISYLDAEQLKFTLDAIRFEKKIWEMEK